MNFSIYKNGKMVVENVAKAGNFFSRLKGLMFKKAMDRNCGLLIVPCNQVHTFNMRFDIDVVFLSKEFKVVYVEPSMKRRKVTKIISGAHYVLELCSGVAEEQQIEIGDILTFKEQVTKSN